MWGGKQMKKKVNGKVVEIRNIELFEQAFEGLALGRLVSSSVADTITTNQELVNKCIENYEAIYKSLPFPLYAVERDIKYATIAMYIKDNLDEPVNMWVDNALYIMVESDKAIKFVGNTWGIVSVQKQMEDNTDIEYYSDEPGYEEYKWVLTKLMNKESLKDYYTRFMRDFVEACNREPMILRWELAHILEFGSVPNKFELKENRLLDVETGSEYFLDIFSTGKRKVGESEYVFDLTGNSKELKKKSKYIRTFDFEVYEKKAQTEDIMLGTNIEKLQKCNLDGAAALFETLAGIGSLHNGIENVSYTGIIAKDYIIYQVGNQLYKCTAKKYSKAVEIGKNIEIYGFENDLLYIEKKSLCDSGIHKIAIYAYDLDNNTVKLCRIQFR